MLGVSLYISLPVFKVSLSEEDQDSQSWVPLLRHDSCPDTRVFPAGDQHRYKRSQYLHLFTTGGAFPENRFCSFFLLWDGVYGRELWPTLWIETQESQTSGHGFIPRWAESTSRSIRPLWLPESTSSGLYSIHQQGICWEIYRLCPAGMPGLVCNNLRVATMEMFLH